MYEWEWSRTNNKLFTARIGAKSYFFVEETDKYLIILQYLWLENKRKLINIDKYYMRFVMSSHISL